MIRNAKLKTRIGQLARPLLANESHVHRRYAAALRAHYDRVDLHVGEMIALRGENIGQTDHRLHQRIDISRPRC